MKKKSTSKSAFFNLRILIASAFCLVGIAVALFAMGNSAEPSNENSGPSRTQDAPGTQTPDVVHMVGPVEGIRICESFPTCPQRKISKREVMTRYPHGAGASATSRIRDLEVPHSSRCSRNNFSASAEDAGAAANL